MKVAYAVPYVEVEFGQRDEGWKVWLDLPQCLIGTRQAIENGRYENGGGYWGPVRPGYCYEIPYVSLSPKDRKILKDTGWVFKNNLWQPQFKGKRIDI